MSRYDIIQLLGSIGVFMFGMSLFEEALNKLGSEQLKQLLKNLTNTRRGSFIGGIVVTTLMQSSTITTLIIIGLTGANLISFQSAFAMILGANVGTTFSTRVVALVGFSFDLDIIIAPLLFISGIVLLISQKNHILTTMMKVCAGFGLLFLGLNLIKDQVSGFASSIDLGIYAHRGIGGFFVIGTIATIIFQSSSLTKALILTGVFSKIISFEQALGMFLGANLGTTFTAFVVSLGANALRKQAALSHVIFNIISVIMTVLIFMALPSAIGWIQRLLYGHSNPTLALAIFDTIFNIVWTLIFLGFTNKITQIIQNIFPYEHQESSSNLLAIESLKGSLRENKLQALDQDIIYLRSRVMHFNRTLFDRTIDTDQITHQYERLKIIHNKLLRFVLTLENLPKKVQEKTTTYINNIQLLMQSAKSLKEIITYIQEAAESKNPIIHDIYQKTDVLLAQLYQEIESQPHQLDSAYIKEKLSQFRTDDKDFLSALRSHIKQSELSEHSMMIITYLHRYSYYSTKALMESIQ